MINLVYTFDKELSNKHYNDDEKIRYIYLRLCEIFSFDTRWFYASSFKDYETIEKILEKSENLKHVDSNLVICHTVVDYLKPLIEMFTRRKVEIYRSDSHSFALVEFMRCKYKLDLTGMNDLAYVKMKLQTKGFRKEGFINPNLNEMDKSLGYNLLNRKEYISKLNINPNLSLFERVMKISDLLDDSRNKFEFSDANAMIIKLEEYYDVDKGASKSDTYVDLNYNFHRLSNIDDKYYDLSKIGFQYKLYEIEEEKYLSLKSTLKKR